MSQKATVGSPSCGPALILVPLLHSMAICGDPTAYQEMQPRPRGTYNTLGTNLQIRNCHRPCGYHTKKSSLPIYESTRSHHQIWGRKEETTGGAPSPFSCLLSQHGLSEVPRPGRDDHGESHRAMSGERAADTESVNLSLIVAKLPVYRGWRGVKGECPLCSVFRPLVTLVLKQVIEMWPG